MSKISRLVAGKSREKRVNVHLDGKYAFSLLAEVALKEGLKVGHEIDDARIETLTGADRYQRCLNAALRFLAYRQRSEAEVRQRLLKHGFDNPQIDKAIARLKEQGLVDDAAFARFWIDNRESFSPRSRRLTKLELQRKGLDNDVIEPVVGKVDDGDSAYRAALSKARRLSPSDYQAFRRRLGQYLGRRGFDYEVIKETVERVWKEQTGVTT